MMFRLSFALLVASCGGELVEEPPPDVLRCEPHCSLSGTLGDETFSVEDAGCEAVSACTMIHNRDWGYMYLQAETVHGRLEIGFWTREVPTGSIVSLNHPKRSVTARIGPNVSQRYGAPEDGFASALFDPDSRVGDLVDFTVGGPLLCDGDWIDFSMSGSARVTKVNL